MAKKSRKKVKKVETKTVVNKKVPFIIAGIILCVFIIVIGISYSMLSVEITGAKTNFFRTNKFEVTFNDGSKYINLTNEGPKKDEEGMLNDPYMFTITNKGNTPAINKIYFSDISSTIPDKYLKIAIKVNDEDYSEPMTLEQMGNVIEEEIHLNPKESITYTIILWIADEMPNTDEEGNNLMNTFYKSKITVESTQETEKKD